MTKKEMLKILEKYRDEDEIHIQVNGSLKMSLVVGSGTCTTVGHTISSSIYNFLSVYKN